MPQLNENKYPQADLIADINAGTSFVKVKPERIGDLIYFDSTLPQAEPQGQPLYQSRSSCLISTFQQLDRRLSAA